MNKIKISEEQFDSLQEDLDMRKDEKFNASRTVQRAETRIGEPNERERLESPFTSCRSRCARNNEYQAAKRCDQLKQALDNATRESEHNYGNLQTDLETSKSENTMLRKLCNRVQLRIRVQLKIRVQRYRVQLRSQVQRNQVQLRSQVQRNRVQLRSGL